MRPIFSPLWSGVALSARTALPFSASANDNATEAIEACASPSEGAVTHDCHAMQGTCRNPPTGEGSLTCALQSQKC